MPPLLKILRSCLLTLISTSVLIVCTNSQIPHDCSGPYNNTADPNYANNVVVSLRSLSSSAASNSFQTSNDSSNGIYSLFLCRGDVNSTVCHDCVTSAAQEITRRCSSSRSAIFWDEWCMLRYSNTNFFGQNQSEPTPILFNVNNSTWTDDPENSASQNFISLQIRNISTSNPLLYSTGQIVVGNRPRYGLVQCTRDIMADQCRDCLEKLRQSVALCCPGRVGWRVLGPSCNIRYEEYPFLLPPSVPPSPPPSGETGGGGGRGNNTTIIAIISVSTVAGAAIIIFLVYLLLCRKRTKNGEEILLHDLEGDDSGRAWHRGENEDDNGEMHYYSLTTMMAATDNFSAANKLGEGGFGPVYKGKLQDGKEIAVKRLSRSSGQGLEEFKNEVKLIIKLQHKNLVRLLGCCIQRNEKLLVYEYLANTSLDAFLFDAKKSKELDWPKRANIVSGIARGLQYLHEDSRLKIIHRDMKASNVLLDDEMNAKISDFGTARIFGGNQIEASTGRIVGTYGYMAPEYAMEGLFSTKSDVYSFGVLLLEIISGRRNNSGFNHPDHVQSLPSYAWSLWESGKVEQLIDQNFGQNFSVTEAVRWINIALLCLQENPNNRPTMSAVVAMLGNQLITLPRPEPPYSGGRILMSDFSSTSGTGTRMETSSTDASSHFS